jgi:hypothetical protein
LVKALKFEAMVSHNDWTSHAEATHLFTILQGQTSDILRNVPVGVAYRDVIVTLEVSYGEQEFAAAVEQLAYRTLVGLPADFFWRPLMHSLTKCITKNCSNNSFPRSQQQVTQ